MKSSQMRVKEGNGDFQGRTGVTRGGSEGFKSLEIGMASFMDDHL